MGLVKPEVGPAFGTCVLKISKGTEKNFDSPNPICWHVLLIIASHNIKFQGIISSNVHCLIVTWSKIHIHSQIDSYIEKGCQLSKINLQIYSSINGLPEKGEWEALSCARERRSYAAAQRKSTPAPAPCRRACPVAGAPAALCRSGGSAVAERASAPADAGLRKPPSREPRTCRRRARCGDSTWRTGGTAPYWDGESIGGIWARDWATRSRDVEIECLKSTP